MKHYEKTLFDFNYKKANPVRTLFYLVKGYRWNIFGGIITHFIKHGPQLVFPIITATMINIVAKPSNHDMIDLWIYAILFGLFIIINIPAHMLYTRLVQGTVRNIGVHLRSSLVRRLQVLSISFHNNFRSGRIQSKVLRDVENVEFLISQIITTGCSALSHFIVALWVSFAKQPIIGFFYVIILPLFVILLKVFKSGINKRNREFRSQIESMSAKISDMIEMIPVTRSHAAETTEIQTVNSKLDMVRNKGMRVDMVNAVFGSSTWVIMMICQLMCLVVSVYLAFKGKIQVGDVVMYQGFFALLMQSVTFLMNIYPEIAKGFESIYSIGEVLECPDLEQNEGKEPMENVLGGFQFDNVSFRYADSDNRVIKNFSLKINAGECIAFVGKSGAGKSTLINLVIGFIRPTSGKLMLDGYDLSTFDLRSYRKYISVVSQNTILFSGTVRDNITYGTKNVNNRILAQAIEMANATEFVSQLPHGLDSLIGEHGSKLSGGQRQRIAIARALFRNPRVLILDEATSALDVHSEKLIQEAISRLIKGRTTFIVAHRLSTIRNADRIVVVNDGQCSEIGSYDELMKKEGEFYRLRSLQF